MIPVLKAIDHEEPGTNRYLFVGNVTLNHVDYNSLLCDMLTMGSVCSYKLFFFGQRGFIRKGKQIAVM